MSRLGVHAGAEGIRAVVLAPDGTCLATAYAALVPVLTEPDRAELAAEVIWRATLQVVSEMVAMVDPATLTGLGVSGRHDTLLLWDHDTMGSPRAAITGADRRATSVVDGLAPEVRDRVERLTGCPVEASRAGPRVAWLAEHEPHTWALVESGRYAVGTVASYLVARMTRGLWHVADVSTASGTLLHEPATGPAGWSTELCGTFGVPPDALPELVATRGRIATTDPRVFLDLAVPITALADEATAAEAGGTAGETVGLPPGSAAALGAAYLAGESTGLELGPA